MPASIKVERRPAAGRSGHAPARRTRASGRPPADLVQQLTRRFGEDADSPDLPLVLVNRVPQTKTVHVVVIWDRWKDLTVPERGRVITDAFLAADPDRREPVTFPMGLTPGEALRQGFLPYQIIPLVRSSDGVSNEQVARAMQAAGGVLLRVGDEVQLRFATRGQANEAYRRLLERINKPIWTISEELSGSEASDGL
jgi:hypothetical protein